MTNINDLAEGKLLRAARSSSYDEEVIQVRRVDGRLEGRDFGNNSNQWWGYSDWRVLSAAEAEAFQHKLDEKLSDTNRTGILKWSAAVVDA